MNGRRLPVVIRRMGPGAAALVAAALTSVLTASLIVAFVSFTQTQTASVVNLAVTADPGVPIGITGSLNAAQQPAANSAIRRAMRGAFGSFHLSVFDALRQDGIQLRRPGRPGPARPGRQHDVATFMAIYGLAAHARLIAGSWPSLDHGPDPVPVAIPQGTAGRLGLSAGSVMTLTSPYEGTTPVPVRVRVSGIFRPLDPAGPYWRLDPLRGTGFLRQGDFTTFGPFVTVPRVMERGPLAASQASWEIVPRLGGMGTGELQPLSQRLSSALGDLEQSSGGAQITTSLPAILGRLASAVLITRSLLLISLLQLLVLGGVTLAFMSRMLAGQRQAESALLRARGAGDAQLLRLGGTEGVLLVAPAVLIGPLAGAWLARQIAPARPLALSAASSGSGSALLWWVAVAIGLASLPVILFPSVRAAVSPLGIALLRGRQHAVGAVSRAGADLALVLLAAAACWELAGNTTAFSASASGQLHLDPALIAAPLIAAPACCVLLLRALPLAVRLADRVAARGRGLALPLASWSVGRRPLRQAGPLLIMMLAIATGVLALAQYQSGLRSAADTAAFTTGSDFRVDLPYGPLPLGEVSRLSGLGDAAAAMPVTRVASSIAGGPPTSTVLGIDPAVASSIVLLRRDLASQPLRPLIGRLASRAVAPGRLLPGRPRRIAVSATLSGTGHRSAITGAAFQLQISDAEGIYYLVDAGTLPADGRQHDFVADIAPAGRAAYPLRLDGVQVSYSPPERPEADRLKVGTVRVSAVSSGPLAVTARLVPHPLPDASRTFAAGPNGAGSALTQAAISFLPSGPVLPAIATDSFLAAAGQHVGAVAALPVGQTLLHLRITAAVSAFPTIPPGTGGIVVDEASLQQALISSGAQPLSVTQWWLRADNPPSLASLATGARLTSRAAVAASLASSPLAVDVREALAAIAAAAALLAIAGFAVSLAAGRERRPELALLEALGIPNRQRSRMLRSEQVLIAVPGAVAGLATGALLARLIVPALTISPAGGLPALPVLVHIPWLLAVALAAVIAVFPVLLAPISIHGSRDTAAVLRVGGQA